VPSALALLFAVVVASPVYFAFDGSIARWLLGLWVAATLIVVASTIRANEAAHAWRMGRVLVPFALIPVLFMVIQIVPLPFLAHPIWQSTAAALDAPLASTISADPALTVQALFCYLTALSILAATACIVVERRCAQMLLRLLVALTGLLTVVLAIAKLGDIRLFGSRGVPAFDATFAAMGNFGMLLAATLLVDAFDQFQTRRRGTPVGTGIIAEFVAACLILAICFAITAMSQPRFVLIAGICGLVPLALLVFLHQVSTHRWEARLVIGIVVVVAAVSVANRFMQGSADLPLRVAAFSAPAQTDAAAQMMADAGPLGMGAGTYAAMVPVYRGIDDPALVFAVPTTAVAIAVEFGRWAVVAIAVAVLLLMVTLFRRALGRGRDSAYAAMGSGVVLVMGLEMFCDASLTETAVVILAAAILGLALGQSLSQQRS
jgi:hypothetical protein